jgi:hypothetical protein
MSAFNEMVGKTRDRNWGGTAKSVACEPYLSGYSYVKWKLPKPLKDFISKYKVTNQNDQADTANSDINASEMLEAACTSVTPPGGTINRAEYTGLGGVKWSVPSSMDYGDSITLRYIEFSGLPIQRIHRAWFNFIRDNKIGLTALSGSSHSNTVSPGTVYNKRNYSATLLYWTTKPDGVTVEFAAAYSGLFPTKDPHDIFTGDITAIDKVEIDMDYNVDMIWQEDWVWKMAQEEAKNSKQGANNHTLWSRDGFRYQTQRLGYAQFNDMPSRL